VSQALRFPNTANIVSYNDDVVLYEDEVVEYT
jgi:hypothetical protein